MNDGLTEQEEKALVGLLYNHVSFGTTLEVFGEATAAGSSRISVLRNTLDKLLEKYNLIDKLSPENFLMLGLVNRIDKSELEAWVRGDNNKHLQLRAQYFKK